MSLSAASATLVQAALGLALGLCVALFAHILRARFPRLDFLYRPIILLPYCIPAFALSLIANAAGIASGFDWILVAFTLVIPLETAFANGAAEAHSLNVAHVGGHIQRTRIVTLPAMLPAGLMGISVAIPWALLSAMLMEVAEGTDGLGLRISTNAALGLGAQAPLIAAAVLISGTGYAAFAIASAAVRRALGLATTPPRRTMLPPRNVEFGPTALVWGLAMSGGMWALMHIKYPIVVGSPVDIVPLSRLPGLPAYLAQTLSSTCVAAICGIFVGAGAALLATLWPWSSGPLNVALLPLQIVPLNAAAPLLILFSVSTSAPVTFDAAPVLGIDWVSIVVGALAAAFVTMRFLCTWLHILPGRESGLLASMGPRNARVLWHVYRPWLSRGVGAFLPALLPRVLLAVLVTEYLATERGIGGALAASRGQRDFKETFVMVMWLIAVTFSLQALVTAFVRARNAVDWGVDT